MRLKKIVKLTDYTYDCNDLTNFESEVLQRPETEIYITICQSVSVFVLEPFFDPLSIKLFKI